MRKIIKNILILVLSFLPRSQHPTLVRSNPQLRWRLGWLRASLWYRPLWALKAALGWGPRIQWGKRVSIWGKPEARGLGLIVLDDDVILDGRPTLFLYGSKAVLRIGACSVLNGTRFGCTENIEIGKNCLLGDARIMDSDFHNTGRQRLSPDAPIPSKPVKIGNNVWIAAAAGILKGVHIGDDSILAFGAIASRSIPAGRIYGGNPAVEVGPVKETKFANTVREPGPVPVISTALLQTEM
jgi:acetyltransferase-like isoleucine patch superfamily enzyme